MIIQRRPAAQHYATVMSPGEFCSHSLSPSLYIYMCELYVLRCVKPSVTPHLGNSLTLTHTHMNADMSTDSSLSRTHPTHIYEVTFVCVMGLTLASGLPLWVLCGLSLCLSLLLSVSLSPCHFFLSFFLFLALCLSFLAVITLIHFLLLARLLHSLWLKKAFIYPLPLGHTHTHTHTHTHKHTHTYSHRHTHASKKRWYGPALPRQTTGPDKLRWHQSA